MKTITIGDLSLSIGDRVGYARWHHWGGRPLSHGFGTVTKINGHGHVTITPDVAAVLLGKPDTSKNLMFDKYGKERGKGNYGMSLVSVESLRADLDACDRKASISRKFQELKDHIKNHSICGNSQVNPTQETADMLKELAHRIETNSWT